MSIDNKKIKTVVAGFSVGALLAVAGAAFAALTVTVTQEAVSGQRTLAGCASTATTTLGTSDYNQVMGAYEYIDVSYSGLADCSGDTVEITAVDSAGLALGTASGTITTGAGTLAWDTPPPVELTDAVLISVQSS